MAEGTITLNGRAPIGTGFWATIAVVVGVAMSGLLVAGLPSIYLVVFPGAAVAVAVLRQPRLGLYLTALALPLDVAGNLISVTGTFNISIAWICTLLTLGSWLADMLVRRRTPVLPREAKVLLAYLLIGAVSLVTAHELDRGVEEVVRVCQTILFFLMVVNLVQTRDQLLLALSLLVGATVASFAYALGQKFLFPANVIAERGLDLLKPGAVTYGIEQGKVDTHGQESVARVTGTTVHAGVLALNCCYMLPFLILFQRLHGSMLKQAVAWGAVLVTFGAFGTTLSRSGFLTLGWTLMMLVATGMLQVTGVRLLAIVLVLLLGIPFVPAGFIDRVLNPASYLVQNSDSLNGRVEMWTAALRSILDNPLTGFGIGNEHSIFDYWRPELRDQLGTVMNTFIQIPMEVGILGLFAFCLFTWLLFDRVLQGRRLWRAQGDPAMALLGTAFFVLMTALVVSWMSVEFLRGGFKIVWFMLGLMVAYHRIAEAASRRPDVNAERRSAA